MNMKIKWLLPIMVFLLLSPKMFGQIKSADTSFKIVGYYFLGSAQHDSIPDTTYSFLKKITHLNVAFINPDSSGNFNEQFPIDDLIDKAHKQNVKVLASIAGGGSHSYYHSLLEEKNRKSFINKLMSVIGTYHFDGVDVDIEGEDIDSNYEKFVIELSAVLKEKKLLITAAISTGTKDLLTDKALNQFDFVNIMSYDLKGPWQPEYPGNHSPYFMAVDDLNYWHNVRNIPKEKLVLGLPFYGYGFGAVDSPVVSMSYKKLSSLYPENLSDTIILPGNVVMYYNNMATIKEKTELAKEKAGGVMIWQLSGDAPSEKSLLNVIDATVQLKKRE